MATMDVGTLKIGARDVGPGAPCFIIAEAGIKECSYLGTPVVNIGARQQGRLNAEHVVHTGYDAGEIVGAVRAQLRRGRYEPSNIYYRPGASETIVDRLASIELYTQKRFCDPVPAGMRTT